MIDANASTEISNFVDAIGVWGRRHCRATGSDGEAAGRALRIRMTSSCGSGRWGLYPERLKSV